MINNCEIITMHAIISRFTQLHESYQDPDSYTTQIVLYFIVL